MKKYTLDQITDGQYVFLERPDETNQLLIPVEKVSADLNEGDIVTLTESNGTYQIEFLKEETEDMKSKVSDLLEKLKNKNN